MVERIYMPTYEYHCRACNHRFERFQSMKASPARKCPACGKNQLERLIGMGAAVNTKAVSGKFPIVSNTLPHRMPGFRHDKYGRTIIRNKKELDRVCKQHGFTHDAF